MSDPADARRRAEEALAHYETCPGGGRWRECSSALAVALRALLAAESRAERLEKVLREIDARTGHFGEAPPPPEWMPMLSLIAWVGRTARAYLSREARP